MSVPSTSPNFGLIEGQVYSTTDLARIFDCEVGYFEHRGGMISRPAHGAVLLMTHPHGQRFDYEDYWDGNDLIYKGRGPTGDQSYVGENRQVGDNSRRIFLFEHTAPAQRRFLGCPVCVEHWVQRGRGNDGRDRDVIFFRLRFDTSAPGQPASENEYREGGRRSARHNARERDPRVVAEAKRQWAERDEWLRCAGCRMSFREFYGPIGGDFIEAHHRVPLAASEDERVTRVSDLAPVCPNCHHILHSGGRQMSVEELCAFLDARRRDRATS